MASKLSVNVVRMGRVYRVTIPKAILELLGNPETFIIDVEDRNGEKVLVLRPVNNAKK